VLLFGAKLPCYAKMIRHTVEGALAAHRAGEVREHVNVVLKVTIPDLKEFSTELDRVVQLTESGEIKQDS
jgi:hypothetical protein